MSRRATAHTDNLTLLPPAMIGPHVDVHGLSDIGRMRARNEDQYLIADLNRTMIVRESTVHTPQRRHGQAKLLAVADGVGGHEHGDVASTLAIEALVGFTLEALPWRPGRTGTNDEILAPFKQAMACCEARVRAEEGGRQWRMATTLTMALLSGELLEVAHVGHGRCYLFRRSQLYRVTRDHTLAELLGGFGDTSSAYPHVLYNAIGGDLTDAKPDLHRMALERDDKILLCTDGLIRHVGDDEIARLLRRPGDSRSCCEALVAAANVAGGEDNITVILACL